MGIRSLLSKPLAQWVINDQNDWSLNPIKYQKVILKNLIRIGKNTQF